MASTDLESAEAQVQQEQQSPDKLEEIEKDEITPATGGTNPNEINQMEIQCAPVTFVGLGKEDLLILANRPFWVRLRWALFITFWLMWLGLLVGAALIIALSPGCESSEGEMKIANAGHHR